MATQAAPGLQVQDRPAVGSGPSAGLPPQERGQHDAAFSRAITALGTRATEQRHQLAKMLDRVEHLESHVARQAGEIMGVRGGQRLHSRVIAHVRQSLASMQAHAATATPEEPSAAATAPLDAPSEPSATAAPQQTPEPTATAAGAPSAAPSPSPAAVSPQRQRRSKRGCRAGKKVQARRAESALAPPPAPSRNFREACVAIRDVARDAFHAITGMQQTASSGGTRRTSPRPPQPKGQQQQQQQRPGSPCPSPCPQHANRPKRPRSSSAAASVSASEAGNDDAPAGSPTQTAVPAV